MRVLSGDHAGPQFCLKRNILMADATTPSRSLHTIWEQDHGRDFAAGLALLRANNPQAVTANILAAWERKAAIGKGINRYDIGKLAEALQKPLPTLFPSQGSSALQVQSPSAPQEQSGPVTTPPPARTELPATQPVEPLPPVATEQPKLTSDEAKRLHKEHAHYHTLMVAATTDEERAMYARKIMDDINPALDREYDRLRAIAAVTLTGPVPSVSETGPVPSTSEAVETEEATEADTIHTTPGPILNSGDMADYKKLQSIRVRLSNLKKIIPTTKDAKKKAKLEKEQATKIAEKDRLEARLK